MQSNCRFDILHRYHTYSIKQTSFNKWTVSNKWSINGDRVKQFKMINGHSYNTVDGHVHLLEHTS